jgi:diamine N-acetyltransferase
MSVQFKVATPAEIDRLMNLMREYYAYDQHEWDEPKLRAALELFFTDEHFGRAWVIFDAEQAIGYLVVTLGFSLEFLGKDAFIDEIYVRPSHQGKGIGKQAMQLAEDYCREEGVKSIHLEVENHNTIGAFYRQLGYEDEESTFMTKWLI